MNVLSTGMDGVWAKWYQCPECGCELILAGFKYCPRCGEKISGFISRCAAYNNMKMCQCRLELDHAGPHESIRLAGRVVKWRT